MKKIILFIIFFILISISIPTIGVQNKNNTNFNINNSIWDIFIIDIFAEIEIFNITNFNEYLGAILYTTDSKIHSNGLMRFCPGQQLTHSDFNNGGRGFIISHLRPTQNHFFGSGIIHGFNPNPIEDNSTFFNN